MKKELLLLVVFQLGIAIELFAGTGNASDMLELFLILCGLLLIVLGLISGADYLHRNGKTMFVKASSFFKTKYALLKEYLHKVKSDHFDPSYY